MGDILHEISRRTIVINKHVEPTLMWHNSVLTVRTDKGISCNEFTQNLMCLDKNIDFIESALCTPKTSPATKYLSNNRLIKSGLRNMELTQLVLDSSFWPYSAHLVQEMVSITGFDWSPPDMCYNNKSVLAVLNNIGNVELFIPYRGNWISALNISKLVTEKYKIGLSVPTCFDDIKQAVRMVESCALCWAPKLNQDGSCYIVTVQKNSNILVWLIRRKDVLSRKLSADFIHCIETDSAEIVSIIFIMKSQFDFCFFYSNVNGEVIVLNCNVNNSVNIVGKKVLWADKDRMIANCLQYTEKDGNILLSFNKHRHFVTLLLDKDYNVLSRYVKNINDHKITVITKHHGDLYVGAVNCEIYKINFIFLNNTLDVKFDLVQLKESYDNYELYGIAFSTNNSICALALLHRKILVRKENMKIDIVLFCKNLNYDSEIEKLLNNPSKRLTHMWDYIELFRYKCVKQKYFPPLEFNKLLQESDSDVYELKVYLIIAIIYNCLIVNMKMCKSHLPESTVEAIRNKIVSLHVQSHIDKLKNLYSQHQKFPTDFLAESFAGMIRYMKLYEKNNDTINDISLDIIKEYNYTCQCCDERIDGFTCASNHLNSFCSISFTPIESSDYLTCNCCRVTARIELYADKPLCIFCDTYLDLYNIPMEI